MGTCCSGPLSRETGLAAQDAMALDAPADPPGDNQSSTASAGSLLQPPDGAGGDVSARRENARKKGADPEHLCRLLRYAALHASDGAESQQLLREYIDQAEQTQDKALLASQEYREAVQKRNAIENAARFDHVDQECHKRHVARLCTSLSSFNDALSCQELSTRQHTVPIRCHPVARRGSRRLSNIARRRSSAATSAAAAVAAADIAVRKSSLIGSSGRGSGRGRSGSGSGSGSAGDPSTTTTTNVLQSSSEYRRGRSRSRSGSAVDASASTSLRDRGHMVALTLLRELLRTTSNSSSRGSDIDIDMMSVLLTGEPSTGKSVLARQFAFDMLQHEQQRVQPLVPVLMTAAEVAVALESVGQDADNKKQRTMNAFVRAAAQHATSIESTAMSQLARAAERQDAETAIRGAISGGFAIFIIDGVDTGRGIGSASDAVCSFVADQLINKGHRVVVTARDTTVPSALQAAVSQHASQVLKLLPLSDDLQDAMVRKRLGAASDGTVAEAFLDALHQTVWLKQLARNPAMLSLAIAAYERDGHEVLLSRASLCRAGVSFIMQGIDAAPDRTCPGNTSVSAPLLAPSATVDDVLTSQSASGTSNMSHPAQSVLPFLKRVAFHQQRRPDPKRRFSISDIRRWEADANHTSGALETATHFMRAGRLPILVSSKISISGGANNVAEQFSFVHPVFQEYLAAAEITERVCRAAGARGDRVALAAGSSASSVADQLRPLLLLKGQRSAAHALEQPRWHNVLVICTELLADANEVSKQNEAAGKASSSVTAGSNWSRLFADAMLEPGSEELGSPRYGSGLAGAGVTALCSLLRASSMVSSLLLPEDLAVQSAFELGKVLCSGSVSTTLQELCIGSVSLPLQQLRTGANVDLSNFGLSMAGAVLAISLLQRSEELNLSGNLLGAGFQDASDDQGGQKDELIHDTDMIPLQEAILSQKSLKSVRLSHSGIDPATSQRFVEICKRNGVEVELLGDMNEAVGMMAASSGRLRPNSLKQQASRRRLLHTQQSRRQLRVAREVTAHKKLEQIAVAHGWTGEGGSAADISALLRPEPGNGAEGEWHTRQLSDSDVAQAIGLGVAQVIGKLRLLLLLGHVRVDTEAAYWEELNEMREDYIVELAEYLSESEDKMKDPKIFEALLGAMGALIPQHVAVQRTSARRFAEMNANDEEDAIEAAYADEEWEVADSLYTLVGLLLHSDVDSDTRKRATKSFVALAQHIPVLLGSHDMRERDSVSQAILALWIQEHVEGERLRAVLVRQMHQKMWDFVYTEDAQAPVSVEHIQCLLDVLYQLLANGIYVWTSQQLDTVRGGLQALYAHRDMAEYQPDLLRATRFLLDHKSAHGSRNNRIRLFIETICKRWPVNGADKQIALVDCMEDLFMAADRRDMKELMTCQKLWVTVIMRTLSVGGLDVVQRIMQHVTDNIPTRNGHPRSRVIHQILLGSPEAQQGLISTVAKLAMTHFSPEHKQNARVLWKNLKSTTAQPLHKRKM